MKGLLVSFIALFLLISLEMMGGAEGKPQPEPQPAPAPGPGPAPLPQPQPGRKKRKQLTAEQIWACAGPFRDKMTFCD